MASAVDVTGDAARRRVLVPQALGADEFLRVTWHRQRDVLVFSQWDGDRCVAALPVRVGDIAELAELTVTALAGSMSAPAPGWPPPDPTALVVPASGLSVPAALRRSA